MAGHARVQVCVCGMGATGPGLIGNRCLSCSCYGVLPGFATAAAAVAAATPAAVGAAEVVPSLLPLEMC